MFTGVDALDEDSVVPIGRPLALPDVPYTETACQQRESPLVVARRCVIVPRVERTRPRCGAVGYGSGRSRSTNGRRPRRDDGRGSRRLLPGPVPASGARRKRSCGSSDDERWASGWQENGASEQSTQSLVPTRGLRVRAAGGCGREARRRSDGSAAAGGAPGVLRHHLSPLTTTTPGPAGRDAGVGRRSLPLRPRRGRQRADRATAGS
jgi:hypothetical protein